VTAILLPSAFDVTPGSVSGVKVTPCCTNMNTSNTLEQTANTFKLPQKQTEYNTKINRGSRWREINVEVANSKSYYIKVITMSRRAYNNLCALGVLP